MRIEHKEAEVLQSIHSLLSSICNKKGHSNAVHLRPSLAEILVNLNMVLKGAKGKDGLDLSVLDIERQFDRYHKSLQAGILLLTALERDVINARSQINTLISENFSTCHNCKGKKEVPEKKGFTPMIECELCLGRGVLEK